MHLTTKRFVLRDFVDDDFSLFAAYRADPRSNELHGPEESDPAHAARLIQLFKTWAAERPRQNFQLATTLLDGSLIGCCGLRMKDAGTGRAELGVELDPAYWGRFGYATEIMKRLVDFGFKDLALTQIFGSTISVNARVSRLAGAFGATCLERPTPDWMAEKGWRRIEWRINRDEWLARSHDNSSRPKPLRGTAWKQDRVGAGH
jgi:RimJ/RimL family protein N-acetyltransferase